MKYWGLAKLTTTEKIGAPVAVVAWTYVALTAGPIVALMAMAAIPFTGWVVWHRAKAIRNGVEGAV